MNSKGQETGCLFAFLKTIRSNANTFNTNKVYIAWDRKLVTDSVNFRKTLTEGTYKGTRDHERNKDVYSYMDEVLKCTTALGIKNIYPGVLEADDVISWLSKNISGKKIIVSVDNDFAQLVAPDISFYNPIKKTIVDTSNFEEQFNLTPKEYLYYKAIVGDVSDNINGIEGFGKIKGQRLAKTYAANQLDVTEEYQAIIKENLKLVDLSYGLEKHPEEIDLYKEQLNKLTSIEPDFNTFIDYCNDLEFNSIIDDMDKWKKTFGKSGINQSIVDFCKRFE